MSLTEIEYGSLASSSVLNGNFQFLQDKITELSALITSETSSFSSTVATLNNSITELLGYKDSFIQTGTIIISQAPEIPSGFLLCDGSEIKIDEYEDLYAVIGTTYGQSDSTTFCIPDLTGRTVFGISEDGTLGDYLEAGLPNITGGFQVNVLTPNTKGIKEVLTAYESEHVLNQEAQRKIKETSQLNYLTGAERDKLIKEIISRPPSIDYQSIIQ